MSDILNVFTRVAQLICKNDNSNEWKIENRWSNRRILIAFWQPNDNNEVKVWNEWKLMASFCHVGTATSKCLKRCWFIGDETNLNWSFVTYLLSPCSCACWIFSLPCLNHIVYVCSDVARRFVNIHSCKRRLFHQKKKKHILYNSIILRNAHFSLFPWLFFCLSFAFACRSSESVTFLISSKWVFTTKCQNASFAFVLSSVDKNKQNWNTYGKIVFIFFCAVVIISKWCILLVQ